MKTLKQLAEKQGQLHSELYKLTQTSLGVKQRKLNSIDRVKHETYDNCAAHGYKITIIGIYLGLSADLNDARTVLKDAQNKKYLGKIVSDLEEAVAGLRPVVKRIRKSATQ